MWSRTANEIQHSIRKVALPNGQRPMTKRTVEKGILFSAPMVRALLDNRKTQTRRIIDLDSLKVDIRGTVRGDGPFWKRQASGRCKAHIAGLGAVSVLSKDGDMLGVKPGEFDFVCPYFSGETYLENKGDELDQWRIRSEVGTRVYVKETFSLWSHSFESVGVEYAAGGDDKIVTFQDREKMPTLESICLKNRKGGRMKRPSIFMPKWASRIWLEITGVRIERLQDITEDDAKAEGVEIRPSAGIASNVCKGSPGPAQFEYYALWESINGKGSWDLNPWVWVYEFRRIKP